MQKITADIINVDNYLGMGDLLVGYVIKFECGILPGVDHILGIQTQFIAFEYILAFIFGALN